MINFWIIIHVEASKMRHKSIPTQYHHIDQEGRKEGSDAERDGMKILLY